MTNQQWILKVRQSGSQTHTATESVTLCAPMKYWPHFWNWKGRFVSAYWLNRFSESKIASETLIGVRMSGETLLN